MAGSRKGARPKGGGELPSRVVQPVPLRVVQSVPLVGDPHFPLPVSGESQRRFEAFTVRGRPFIATTRGPESSKPTPQPTKAATRGGAPSAINVSPRYLQDEQSTRGEPRSPHSPRSPCSPLAPRSPHTPRSPHMRGASREFSSSLLRLWNEDEEWRSEAVFRSILVRDSFKPGARTLEAQRELGETEDKLLRTVRRILYAKLLRRFRLWHRRAAVLKLLDLLSRPLVRSAMTLWRDDPLRARRALRHLTNRQLSCGWHSWAAMATERREAMELMRRSLSSVVNRKLTMGFQSWLGANAADAVAQGQRDSLSKSLLHLLSCLDRELSRAVRQWANLLVTAASMRLAVRRMMHRSLAGALCAWSEQASLRAAEKLRLRAFALRWSQQQLSRAFHQLAERAAEKLRLRAFVLRWSQQQLSSAFHQLAASLSEARRDLERTRRGLVLLMNREFVTAWRTWLAVIEVRAAARAAMQHAVALLLGKTLAASLRTWGAAVADRLQPQRLRTLVAAWMQRLLVEGWRSWLSIVEERTATRMQGAKAAVQWQGSELATSLRTWLAAAARKKHRSCSITLGGLRCTGAAWRSWRSFAEERCRLCTCTSHGLTGWSSNQLALGLRSLMAAAAKSREELRLQLASWVNQAVAASWRTWQSMLTERAATLSVVRGALLVFARRQLASGLRTWSDAAAAKKLRLRSMVLNGLQRIAVAWRSWLSLLGSQAETLVLMGHALATWTNQQLAIGLRTWVAAATETMQRQRALIAAWIKRLLTAGWRSWRSTVEEHEAGQCRARLSHHLHHLGVGRGLALAWRCWVATWESALSEHARAAARGAGLELEAALEARHRLRWNLPEPELP